MILIISLLIYIPSYRINDIASWIKNLSTNRYFTHTAISTPPQTNCQTALHATVHLSVKHLITKKAQIFPKTISLKYVISKLHKDRKYFSQLHTTNHHAQKFFAAKKNQF